MSDDVKWDDEASGGVTWDDEAKPQAKPEIAPTLGAQAAAFARGVTRAVPFSQDIGAGLDVARTYVGGHPAGVPAEGPFGERYAAAKERQKAIDESLSRTFPKTSVVGTLAGAVAMPMSGPAAGIAARAEPLVGRGMAGALGAGTVGAGYGALYGAGEGDTLEERLRNAKTGAVIGGVGGAAIPAIVGAAGRGVGWAAEKAGIRRPGTVAQRELSEAFRSAPGDTSAMTPAQVQEALAAGQPVLPIDVGGAATKQLAKTAASVSPEARGILATELYQRTKEQAPRLYDFAEQLIGKRLDDPDVIANLRRTASQYNNPAYATAMQAGSGGVWNNRLGQLINHPWIKSAIPQAIDESNAAAVISGKPGMKNPFIVDKAGNYSLPVDAQGNVTRPTLEFWDTLKKNIQGKITAAEGTPMSRGDPNTVRIGTQLKNALTGELYSAVPEYRTAVQGAGRYLGEEDAYRFGAKFLKAKDASAVNAGKKSLSQFTPEEREMATHSYMAERLQQYLNRAENQDIAKAFMSPVMKAKDEAILGPDAANKFHAFIFREGLMHGATSALGGSDTAPKLLAMARQAGAHGAGLWGGAGLGAVHGYQTGGLDPKNMAENIAGGALLGLMAQRGLRMTEKANVEIAKKLVSSDPTAVQEALDQVANNPQMMSVLEKAYQAALPGVSVRGAVEFMPRKKEPERAQRAAGGRVDKRDYPAKRMSKLERAALRARGGIAQELEPVMQLPDDAVADALALAK